MFDVFVGLLLLHDLVRHCSLHDLDGVLPCIWIVDDQIWQVRYAYIYPFYQLALVDKLLLFVEVVVNHINELFEVSRLLR